MVLLTIVYSCVNLCQALLVTSVINCEISSGIDFIYFVYLHRGTEIHSY